MGATLRICYADSAYDNLIRQVEENLKMNHESRTRHEALIQNLLRTVNVINNSAKQLKTFAAQREETRIYFDHYRVKLDSLTNAKSKSGSTQ